jgi:murein DD-endopeptidase MepM/ murein hydrolase activator NlpD
MRNTIRLILTYPSNDSSLRLGLTYFSILLFIILISFASVSVNRYISDTMSITLAGPESSNISDEMSEETSVTITIQKGDTLKTILINQNLPSSDISEIIKVANQQNASPLLKIGQQITFDYELKIIENEGDDLANETRTLTKLTLNIDKIRSLSIIRQDDTFIIKNNTIPLNQVVAKSATVIKSNFISALKSLGLSTNTIIELINSYSYQIDFQRQIQQGDIVTVITEKFVTEDGEFSHHGKILYASLNLSGKEYNIYRYSHDNSPNNHSFFSEDGKSVKRSLLRTPVNLVRVSSNYGNRKHPIEGFTKMHKGVDFAAPSGTPIYAAGSGVITEIGWKQGYGKFIQIKHSPTLSTAYAHASSFAKNLKAGARVNQGQIIAYVGSTGRTTGAHLHYEVKIDGKHVNPMSIKTTPGIELKGKQLAKFEQFKKKIRSLSAKLDNTIETSAANLPSSSL